MKQNTFLIIALLVIFTVSSLTGCANINGETTSPELTPPQSQENSNEYTLVIYGGGFAACAAARQAASLIEGEQKILMVVPERSFGAIGTMGGQNFFDLRRWQGQMVTMGSFQEWFHTFHQGYPTEEMARVLYEDILIEHRDKVKVLFGFEIAGAQRDPETKMISQMEIGPVRRNQFTMKREWIGEKTQVKGDLFLDASDTGRLTRLAGVPVTSGRYDRAGDNYQQAATLMFKIKGIDQEAAKNYRHPETGEKEFIYFQDQNESWLGWGGHGYVARDPVISSYNGSTDYFFIKGYNAAEDTPGTWWINTLVIHKVDGRKNELDRDTPYWPEDSPSDTWSRDTAYLKAYEEIQKPEFLDALRRFPGFENVELVTNTATGDPVVADILYLRETIHAVKDQGKIGPESSETNYGLAPEAVRYAGDKPDNGADQHLYPYRVGLAFYWIDLHGYVKGDLTENELQKIRKPNVNPCYLPWQAFTTPYARNLIIPGYAQSTASEPWGAIRVIPNMTVCGDAAGVGAAYCLNNNKLPNDLEVEDLDEIRKILQEKGVRLEK